MTERPPCPCCGNAAISIATSTVAGVCRANGHAVKCSVCGLATDGHMTQESADAVWSRRPTVEITEALLGRAMAAYDLRCSFSDESSTEERMRAALAAAFDQKDTP